MYSRLKTCALGPLRQWCLRRSTPSFQGAHTRGDGEMVMRYFTTKSSGNGDHTLGVHEVETLHEKFQFAHEAVANIAQSAAQAQMEHEPSERVPAVEYRIRYARFALREVEDALAAFDVFCREKDIELFSERHEGNYHGQYPEHEVQKLRRQKAFLDSYRDNLKAELAKTDCVTAKQN
eukprot:gb/GECG01007929.1/.p1 GENE.gb/GECG01007929.1/~~gb/GECG01007929.1/.p1  ORF type:complete len:178 (+),score=23.85 gb/GECG01007929.1/:1-534(+)